MKPLLVTLGTIGVLITTSQLLRHTSVVLMPPTASVLDKFDDKPDKDNVPTLSIEELTKQYEDVRGKVKVLDAGKTEDEHNKVDIWTEPYKTENKLRTAIQTWENRNRDVAEVHFFWWCGFLFVVFGSIGFAVALLTTGVVQMLYGTCPAIRFLGGVPEFERLVMWKLVYSSFTFFVLFFLWAYLDRITKRDA